MARSFNGSSDKLSSSSSLTIPATFTVSAWGYKTSSGVATIIAKSDATAANAPLFFRVGSASNSGFTTSASTYKVITNPAEPSLNAWHQFALTYSGSALAYWIDGSSTSAAVTGTPQSASIGMAIGELGDFTGGTQWWPGRLAEVGIWDAALTAAEIASLAAGVCPLLVRPASLVSYWPLWGNYSPEIDRVGGFDLAVTGATKADHPRIINASRPKIFLPAAVTTTYTASGTLTSGPSTLSGSATFAAGTKTATATLLTKGTTFAGNGTFTAPVYTGTATLLVGAGTLSGSVTFSPGTKTATGAFLVGAGTFSGSATFSPGTKTGSSILTSAPAVLDASAAFSAGTKTASGTLLVEGATLTASGTFVTPTYEGSATLTVGASTFAGEAIFATVVYVGSSSLTVGETTLSGSATHTTPTYTGTASLSSGRATLSGSGSFVVPSYTASAALSSAPVLFVGNGTTITPVFSASMAVTVGGTIFAGSATFVDGGAVVVYFRKTLSLGGTRVGTRQAHN